MILLQVFAEPANQHFGSGAVDDTRALAASAPQNLSALTY
jgi:hypothetical protein